ncbi:Hsp20/alpha crystallin family protein [Halobacillus rhizosphaerae]|uniref:Hsp20/alpha crystallin family protein n=1 Tax=Halobacillus rhizosphaerae TaxID=3064889 RepID=UPI00398B75E4
MNPFQSLFPFGEDVDKWMKASQSNDIHKFVNGVLSNSMPKGLAQMPGFSNMGFSNMGAEQAKLNETVFDSHDHVYVKIPIHDPSSLDSLKIYHKSYQLIIEGVPYKGDLHTITLPSLVRKKGTVARYRDNELQIRLPKKIDTQYSEVNIDKDL